MGSAIKRPKPHPNERTPGMLAGIVHFGAVSSLILAIVGAILETWSYGTGFQIGTFTMCDATGCGSSTVATASCLPLSRHPVTSRVPCSDGVQVLCTAG